MKGIANAKKNAGISDSELNEIVAEVGKGEAKETLDGVVAEAGLGGKPIHHLVVEGNSLEILSFGANATLQNVRYLEFSRSYKETEPVSLSQLIQKVMVSNNLVCYWKGSDLNLWRITDCFHGYYNQKQWSNVACVSAQHVDAKPLLERMESMFEATLKKEQTF